MVTTLASHFLEDNQWVMKGEGTSHLSKEDLHEMKAVSFHWNEACLRIPSRETAPTYSPEMTG